MPPLNGLDLIIFGASILLLALGAWLEVRHRRRPTISSGYRSLEDQRLIPGTSHHGPVEIDELEWPWPERGKYRRV